MTTFEVFNFKTKNMKDVRYTAIGYSNEISEILNLEIGIPREDISTPYRYEHYDLTTRHSEGKYLNVVLTNLVFGEEELGEVHDYFVKKTISLKESDEGTSLIIGYRDRRIDLNNPEILFLLVHDNNLTPESIREIKRNIFDYHGRAKIKSTYISSAYPKEDPIVSGRPRTIGMSIIKR